MIHYQIAGENEKATAPDPFSPVLFAQPRKKGIIIKYYIKIERKIFLSARKSIRFGSMGSERIVISGKGIFGMASSPTMLWMEKA